MNFTQAHTRTDYSVWAALLVLLIALPVVATDYLLGRLTPAAFATAVLCALGLAAACIALKQHHRVLILLAVSLLIAVSCIRIAYAGLIYFSGSGFTTEFVQHLNLESVRAGWSIFGWWVVVFLLGAIVYIGLSLLALARCKSPTRPLEFVWMALCVGTLALGKQQLPEYSLLKAVVPPQNNEELNSQTAKLWQDSPIVQTQLVPKQNLQLQSVGSQENIILVYLESVGQSIFTHPEYPGLMPNLEELSRHHSPVQNFYSSAYITIEGLTNSQCGTLFPFDRAEDSLSGGRQLAEQMPCLGDILQAAGYNTLFMGGARLAFSGKGAFLKAHGYTSAYGSAYWNLQGLYERPGTWGISDADLFKQSLLTIEDLTRSPQKNPFFLTLLTIGTHIPGFRYSECHPYPNDSHRYVQALNCTDQLLAEWLNALKERGVLDNTWVVITADHQAFSTPELIGLFSKPALSDPRLPFIVIGPDSSIYNSKAYGSSYDLAPSILDLVKIEHNARFALGRSVFQSGSEPYYSTNRYREFFNGEIFDRKIGKGCEDEVIQGPSLVSQPLSSCEKFSLYQLLREQNRQLSNTH